MFEPAARPPAPVEQRNWTGVEWIFFFGVWIVAGLICLANLPNLEVREASQATKPITATVEPVPVLEPLPRPVKPIREPDRDVPPVWGGESKRQGISSGWSEAENVSPEDTQKSEAEANKKKEEQRKIEAKKLRETAAKKLLNAGKNYELNFMYDFAATKLKEAVLNYPDTDAAIECKSRLEYLEFKKK